MSILQMVKVWEHEFSHPKQSVMLALADHAHDDGTEIRPSFKRIAWKTGYSHRNVRRIIKELKSDKVLKVQKEATNKEPAVFRFDWTKATKKESFREYLERTGGDNLPSQSGGDKLNTLRGQVEHLEGTSQTSGGDKLNTLRGSGCPPNHPITVRTTINKTEEEEARPQKIALRQPSTGAALGSPSALPPGKEEKETRVVDPSPTPPRRAETSRTHNDTGFSRFAESGRQAIDPKLMPPSRKSAARSLPWTTNSGYDMGFVKWAGARAMPKKSVEQQQQYVVKRLGWLSTHMATPDDKAPWLTEWSLYKEQQATPEEKSPYQYVSFAGEWIRNHGIWRVAAAQELIDRLESSGQRICFRSYSAPRRVFSATDENGSEVRFKQIGGDWEMERRAIA